MPSRLSCSAAVGAVLGAREHERLVDLARAHQVREQLALALAIHRMDDLLDEVDGGVLRVTWTDAGRSRRPGQRRGSPRECGAEEQVLSAIRQQREHLADVADEAHVEHPIGLVEDEDLDPAQVDGALAGMVEQTAGRGDDDLGAAAQRADLAAEADAAVDGGRADVAAGVDPDRLLDLDRQLAGRGEDERADATVARRRRGQTLQHRQHEGGGLAGAGLGAGEQVATIEHERNRFALDGGGIGVTLARNGTEQVGPQPEFREGQGRELLTRPTRDAWVAGPGQGEKVSRDRTEMRPRRRPVRLSNTCAKCNTSIRCTLVARPSPEQTQKRPMTDRCIHGFEPQICASCRRCPHGLLESRCSTCSPKTARDATLMLANDAPRGPEEHRGYEISYVAGERSWYIRADADAAPLERLVSPRVPGAPGHRRDPRPSGSRGRDRQEGKELTPPPDRHRSITLSAPGFRRDTAAFAGREARRPE